MFRGHPLAALGVATVLLAAASLLAVACGDDSVSGEEALQELQALADRATEGAAAKVTYAVTMKIDDDTSESEQIVVQRPPDSRLEISVTGDETEARSVVIDREDVTIICLARQGDASCLEFLPGGPSFNEALAQATLHLQVESPLQVRLFDMPRRMAETATETDPLTMSRREILDLDATCFKQVIPNLQTEVCFSDEGLTLYWRFFEISADGIRRTFEASATSVSSDVTDSDFEPPYEVVEGARFDAPIP